MRDFAAKHADAENELNAWFKEAEHARWSRFADIREKYKDADQVGEFVVFNICRNKYRLTVSINYAVGIVFVKYVDTHAEYDRRKLK